MARFNSEIPNDLMKSFQKLEENTEKIFGEMTKAGAKLVYNNVKSNMSKSFKNTKNLVNCLRITKTYKTKSDDGINTKVGIYGYFINENGKKVPAPLVANAREYGTSRGEKRKPFFRKSFKKSEIELEMKKVQDKYLPKE